MDEELQEIEDDAPFVAIEDTEITEDEENVELSICPKFNYENMQVVVDPVGRAVLSNEVEAYRFWVKKCLLTERYIFEGYSTDFGVALEEIIRSNSDREIAESEVMREIEEALSIDDRTVSVEGFDFVWRGDQLFVSFTIESVFGEEQVLLRAGGDGNGGRQASITSISG